MCTGEGRSREIETMHYGLSNVIIRNKSCQLLTKVKHYYALILHRISFKTLLNVAKLPKVLYKYTDKGESSLQSFVSIGPAVLEMYDEKQSNRPPKE